MTVTEAELDVLRTYVAAIGAGDVKTILSCLHPEFVLNEPDSLPYGGDHVGRDGFVALARAVYAHYDTELLDSGVYGAGEFAVVRMRFRFTAHKTGASMELPLAEFYRFADGLLVRGEIFYRDTKAVLDLLAG